MVEFRQLIGRFSVRYYETLTGLDQRCSALHGRLTNLRRRRNYLAIDLPAFELK